MPQDDATLNAFELDRLDLFATQTLLKCLLCRWLQSSADPVTEAELIAQLFENSVRAFDLQAASSTKVAGAKDYMLDTGHAFIASALNPRPGSG